MPAVKRKYYSIVGENDQNGAIFFAAACSSENDTSINSHQICLMKVDKPSLEIQDLVAPIDGF